MAVTRAPIAIVGVGCRLAGDITTPEDFWSFLLAGGSAVREVPAERWAPYLHRDPRHAAVLRETTRFGTFLDDLPGFDAEFFGVSPREAELMDPQQRLAVEVSWEALEHAGIPPRALAGSDTAVLMGVNSDDYGKLLMEDLAGIEAWTGIGTSLCGVANRVSHLLDLRGPSVALDAACAASLVAVHQACQLLADGETSLALAGGVSALIGPGLTRVLDVAGATAPDGRCKTFDAAADGYGRGEGAGVVVLKRLADARRDGDRILAVVRGGAVAQDGRTVGIMSPNGDAQRELFETACRAADLRPADVGYIEAHGTGTPTGDPVEIAALSAVYGGGRGDAPCAVGSVKPNVGHLEGGAGVIGLIKAALALHHETLPPTAGIETLTPAVDWAASGLRVPTVAEPWPRGAVPRRAAVCSYGYGGTLAHVLLDEAPITNVSERDSRTTSFAPFSARSADRLTRQAAAMAEHLRRVDVRTDELAATLWTRRSHEPVRAAVVTDALRDPAGVVDALSAAAQGARHPRLVTGAVVDGAEAGAVWVFSGHGSHWAGMGRELLATEPRFAATIDEIDDVFIREMGFSARAALTAEELGGTDRVQALTFAMQVGLAAVLRARGVAPAAIIGHSVGEVAACVEAGVFGLTHGAAIACYRARGFRSVAGRGAMALAGLPFDDAAHRLRGRSDVVAAISASPASTVVSGTTAAVEALAAAWAAEGITVRRVNTDVAFHSPAMDALTDELARAVAALPAPAAPRIPLYSTALGDPRSRAPRDRDYWVANLRGRVRFAEAVQAAAQDGYRVYVEVSAHPVVAHSIAETLLHESGNRVGDHAVVPVLRRDQPERRSIGAAAAALYCHGVPIEHGLRPTDRWAADLPATQWRHRRFWRTPTPPPSMQALHDPAAHTLLGGAMEVTGPVPARVWQTRLDMDTRPYPGDHPVRDTEIVPAAVLVNTLMGAAGGGLTDVRLRTPVPPGRARDIQVVHQDRALRLSSRPVGTDTEGWVTHCGATAADYDDADFGTLDADVRSRCRRSLPASHVVDALAEVGVAGMGFGWRILEMHCTEGEVLARVAAEADGSAPTSWAGLLDAATSTASTVLPGPMRLRMPAHIEAVHVRGAPPAVALLHVRHRGETVTDVAIADDSGAVRATLRGMRFADLEPAGGDVSPMLHRMAWHPTPYPQDAAPREVVLVGGDDAVAAVGPALTAAGIPHRRCSDPALLPRDLQRGSVVLAVPQPGDAPEAVTEAVLRALTTLRDNGSQARLWVLTRRVHEGERLEQAPLWGLARIAAAEHPQLWGGVLDVADGELPVAVPASLHGHGVVVVRDGVALTARLAPARPGTHTPMTCTPGGVYVITGGTGALGLLMARRLADLGARRLVLLSRTGVPPRDRWTAGGEVVRVITELEERGVFVRVAALDIGADGAGERLRAVLADLPPVRGVVHAAGVEAGALLTETTPADLRAVMRPKVTGTLTLHDVFPPGALDWMVLFSSCGYLAGFPGQGAYACANAFLDAVARHRSARGDRTVSVAWTAWRGLGMGSSSEFVAAQLDALGMGTVAADDALRALDAVMRGDDPNPVVLPVLAQATAVPVLADVAPRGTGDPDLAAATGPGDEDVALWAAQQVVEAVAGELGLPAGEVDPAAPLIESGVDSIMTVALRRSLEKRTGLALPPTLLWEHPTAAEVTARIVELLQAPPQRRSAEVS